LIWDIYKESICTDYSNEDLMDKFSKKNWEMYNRLKNRAMMHQLDQRDAKIDTLENRLKIIEDLLK